MGGRRAWGWGRRWESGESGEACVPHSPPGAARARPRAHSRAMHVSLTVGRGGLAAPKWRPLDGARRAGQGAPIPARPMPRHSRTHPSTHAGTALAALTAAAPRRSARGGATRGQATLQLLNCILGAGARGGMRVGGRAGGRRGGQPRHTFESGLLSLPFVFRSLGLALGALAVAAAAALARLSLRLLLAAGGAAGERSLAGVARAAFGSPGAAAARLCVAVLNFGALVAYINVLADVGGSAAVAAGWAAPRAALAAAAAAATGAAAAAAAAAPVLITLASTASVALALAFAGGLAALGAAPRGPGPSRAPLALWRPAGLPAAAPLVAYAFTCHQALAMVTGGMAAPSLPASARVVDAAVAAAAAAYAAAGAGGYAAFGEATAGDVGINLSSPGGGAGVGDAARAAYALSLLGAAPLVLAPLTASLVGEGGGGGGGGRGLARPAKGPGAPRARRRRAPPPPVAAHAAVLAAALAASIALPSVEAVLGAAGATAGAGAGFLIPALSYLRLAPPPPRASRPLSASPWRRGGRDWGGVAAAWVVAAAGCAVAAAGAATAARG